MSYVQSAILTTSTVLCFASCAVVCLRLYDRRYIRRMSFASDDYAVMVSLFFIILWTISTIVWTSRYHLGTLLSLEANEYRIYMLNSYINRLFYALGFDIAKVAIILFYMRLTNRFTQRLYWRLLCVILAFMIFDVVGHFFVLAVPCSPVNLFWQGSALERSDKCWSTASSAKVINVFTFFSEGLIVLTPIPMLWLAGLNGRQRFALALMFSLGILIILASALKLRYVLRAQTRHHATYDTGIAYIWIAVEANVALLVAGFLPLKALLEAHFRAVKRRFSSPNTSVMTESAQTRSGSLATVSDPYALYVVETCQPQPSATTETTPTVPAPKRTEHTKAMPQDTELV